MAYHSTTPKASTSTTTKTIMIAGTQHYGLTTLKDLL
jgi:hypothetical protein